jgi:hypothetical protein
LMRTRDERQRAREQRVNAICAAFRPSMRHSRRARRYSVSFRTLTARHP